MRFRIYLLVCFLAIALYNGCGGETNSGVNCRFALTERIEQRCSGNACTCSLNVSIRNIGTMSVSGMLHYDAYNDKEQKFAYAEFVVATLSPGSSRQIENNIRELGTNRILSDCTSVARVEASNTPGCP